MGYGSRVYVPYYIILAIMYSFQAILAFWVTLGPGQFCTPVCPLLWSGQYIEYQEYLVFDENRTGLAGKKGWRNIANAGGGGEMWRYDFIACGRVQKVQTWYDFFEEGPRHVKSAKSPGVKTGLKQWAKFKNSRPGQDGEYDIDFVPASARGLMKWEEIIDLHNMGKPITALEAWNTYTGCRDASREQRLAQGEACECEDPECPAFDDNPFGWDIFYEDVTLGGMKKQQLDSWNEDIEKVYINEPFFCLQCPAENSTELWQPCRSKKDCANDVMDGFKKVTPSFQVSSRITMRSIVRPYFLGIGIMFAIQGLGSLIMLYGMRVFSKIYDDDWRKLTCCQSTLGVVVKLFPGVNRLVNVLLLLACTVGFFIVFVIRICEDARDTSNGGYPFGLPTTGFYAGLNIALYILTCGCTFAFRQSNKIDTAFAMPVSEMPIGKKEKDMERSRFHYRRWLLGGCQAAKQVYFNTGP